MDPALATALAILAAALLIDFLYGEYPAAIHPVVWIGTVVTLLLKVAPKTGWWRQLIFSALLAATVPLLSAWAAAAISHVPVLFIQIVAGAYLLKASLALRELGAAAERVRAALVLGDLQRAREALRSLCSRDPAQLDEEALIGAAVESLAENLSDSFVAPLFYYALFGVPGAIAYRAINTLDAMIGYRGPFEALGKAAARLDDLANLIPARLTAGLLLFAGLLTGQSVAGGWRIYWRDRAKTPSPNAGRPMAMMAGLLGVRLEKQGGYSLGDAAKPLVPETVCQAWRVVAVAAWLAAAASAAAVVLLHLRLWSAH